MKPISFLIIAFAGLFFSSCSDKNKVNLTETNAREEVPVLGNLTFTFDKNLVPDSMLNRWVDDEPIAFTPKIKGKFRWKNVNELVFSPSEPLDAATDYEGKGTKGLTRYSTFSLGNTDDIKFHTPYLRFEQNTGMWISRELGTSDIVPELTLRFNYAVKPDEVSSRLVVKNGQTEVALKCMTEDPGKDIVYRLMDVKAEDKDLKLAVKVAEGLLPKGGKTASKSELTSDILIPSPFALIITETQANHDGTHGTVQVYCSQRVASDQNLKDFIALQPAVAFQVSYTDEGMLIKSEQFDVEKSYELIIKTGLRGSVGGTLKESFSTSLTFGKLEPSINFADQNGVYLGGKGARNLEVRIVNVNEVKVVITKIYENNLLSTRKYGYYRDYYDDEYADESNDQIAVDDYENSFGDVVYEKVIKTKNLPRYGNSRLFHFSFPDNLPDFKGIYHVRISSSEEYYLNDSKYVSLSDIGLIARQSKNNIYVFAASILSAKPVNGVNVTAYGLNNQKIGNATTNADGYAVIALTRKNTKGFTPAMITAKLGNDFNYMPMSSTRVETSRFDVGGIRNNATGLRAFVYGDRDIYRPGEKVHFSALLRDMLWKSPGAIPIKVKILLPNGQELKAIKKALNDEGSMESFVDLSPSAVSGTYSIEVYTSTDVLLSSKSFLVEEFVPDRIKVKTTLNKTAYNPGEKASLSLLATNLFGPPAANRNYELDIQLKEKAFRSEKFPNYQFTLNDRDNYYESVVTEGETDAEGKATESYEIPAYYKDKGILQADFFTTVFDETGRPVSRAATANVYTQQVFYGIRNDGYGYYALNQPVRFDLIALSKDDKPFAKVKARILVIKHDYKTVVSKYGSYFRYESQRVDKTVVDKEVLIEGSRTYFTYVPRNAGDYEVRIARPGAGNYVSTHFYSYGWYGNYGAAFEVNREGNVDISSDRTTYSIGEKARLLFKTPFNGKLLVTVEQNELLNYYYLEAKDRAASLELPLSSAHLPNIYVTATLIKPHTQSDLPLTVAHGFKSLVVEDLDRKMLVKIDAVGKSRSNTKQRVKVKAQPGALVTLSAVDEGILQITQYKTPDPYSFFYAKRALELTAFDLYPYLLPEIRPSQKSSGGDGYDLSKRVNPLPNKRVKLVAQWSGITDAGSGEVSFDVDIPQFSGEIRLMAVAYKGDKFGSAETAMKVADPIVVSTGLPRFISPGDTVYASVTLANTTDKSAQVNLQFVSNGAVRPAESVKNSLQIGAGSEARKVVKLIAGNSPGLSKITVSATAFGETFKEEIDITVRPAASLSKENTSGFVIGGAKKSLELSNTLFMQGSEKRSLIVSRSPVIQFAEQLQYLVQYPYGCTEQVVSTAFPQLYFGDLADLVRKDDKGKAFANYHIQEAIRTIKMRQLYSGGLTLWDYGGQEDWWATAYAAHFLLEAKKAGFEVEQSLMNKLFDYLSAKVKMKEQVNYNYNRTENKRIAPKSVSYSLFVLALAGKPDVSTMNYYKQHLNELALDSRYLLATAYAISGDRQKFREVLPASFSGEISETEGGGSFYSAIRDEAVSLYAIMTADPGNSQIGVMAGHLSAALKANEYLSTQERVFSFLCLGKLAKQSAGTDVKSEIKVDGKTIGSVTDKPMRFSNEQLKGKQIEISSSGNGKMYYYFLREGIPLTPVKETDHYMKVRKSFYDRYGREITSLNFRANDLVIVKLTLEKAYNRSISNVVLTDLLPAGFEIENSRVKNIPGMSWISNESYASHTDVRDDRINFFIDLNNNVQTYYYAVRAVTPGYYHMGPAMADAMYQGEIHSYNGAGAIKISER